MITPPLYIRTPMYENPAINARLNRRVFLKMECYQPTGSFKARGIGALCRRAVEAGQTALISSSGGNAGYSAAYAGRVLGVPVTVVVPESTGTTARQRIESEGAEVIVHGAAWDDADALARKLVEERGAAYIHPFDNPAIWDGHATLIDEAAEQCPKPDLVIVAVGGGGLLCGVLEGMHRHAWADVPVIAVETRGAASFAASIASGTLETLPAITSIASTLGAKTVTPKALDWTTKHTIAPVVVGDSSAVSACLQFADDMRVVVEPACGAALSLVYDNAALLRGAKNVLVIVCGGAGVTYEQLKTYEQELSGVRRGRQDGVTDANSATQTVKLPSS
ncbi:pyridoxal-phosphate dependent enzyme [Aggregatilinea lenta]|uniref:pyridoxal-phosphate dependent enzyme n=1 Tax=Aggregatilinea lenta TaxID=913108 RepID=UPI000E5BC5FB|nr:pyridoxal-phosphate dependent enzyme [Aggregatilinea lenta]